MRWRPGQFAFLSAPEAGLGEPHPFTIANAPEPDGRMNSCHPGAWRLDAAAAPCPSRRHDGARRGSPWPLRFPQGRRAAALAGGWRRYHAFPCLGRQPGRGGSSPHPSRLQHSQT
ncbi:MAG: hypothetical protein V9G18_01295 [Albidovulum sp.]